jgi:hypothetical protein
VRAGRVDVELSLTSPAGQEPSALQWDTKVPSSQLGLTEGSPQPGPVAQEADKGVSCAMKATKADTQTIVCLVYGGRKPIRNGVVARFSFKIPPQATTGSALILLDNGVAVSADLKRTPIPDTTAIITIRTQ